MSRPAPPKPPRLRKTKSIDSPRETHTQNDKDLYPPNMSSSVHLSSISPSSSTHSPPPIPPFKPNGKPAIPTSVAAANIIKALKRAQSVDDSRRDNDPQEDDHNDFSKCKSYTENSYIIIEEDLSSRTARPVSMFEHASMSEYKSPSSSIEDTKKIPLLPTSFNNSYPSKIPRLPSHREEEEEEEKEEEDNIRKYPVSTQKSLSTLSSGQTTPTTKIPILPPGKSTVKTLPKRPDPPPKTLSRTKSEDSPFTQTVSNSYHKPLPLPPKKSHKNVKISPEESPKPVLNGINTSSQEETIEHLSNHESTQIPVSPSSVSSGVPEDEGEVFSCDSRQTTPSCITFSESIFNEGLENRLEAANDETDGGQPSKQTNKQPRPPIPPRSGQNQPKLKLKSDDSWIQKRQLSPATSPNELTSSTPAISSQPYRSHHIINVPEIQQSQHDILANRSKAMIGSSGIYYPPAVRSITPEPLNNAERDDSSEGTTEEKDEVPVLKVPHRFKKTRRSNSFNGTSSQKVRPTSMIEDVFSKDKDKKNNELTSSSTTTVPRGLTESTKEDYKHVKKLFKRGPTDINIKSGDTPPKRTVLGLFKARNRTGTALDNVITKNQEQNKVEETVSEDSSEDETGGTIKRMPKYGSLPRKPHKKSTEPSSDDYEPEYHQLFEYVFVMGLKEDRPSKKLKTEITYRFPPDSGMTSEDETLRSIDQFCFPDIEQWKPVVHYNSESYSFVLTSLEGNRRFGYCRRLLPDGKGPRLPEVFCIVSPLGCFDLYAKILDIVEQRRAVSSAAVFTFLKSIIANPFPAPGRSVSIKVLPAKEGDLETIKLKRPPDSRLEHVDFAELYNTLGPKKLIQVFSSIIMERRVILAANRLSTLSSCCHALLALLYPFEWQHTFIPVLPNSLIDFCGSPVPYIIGINPSLIKQLDHLEIEMEEALVVDLDKRKFVRKFGDEPLILPSKLSQYLVHMLDAAVIKNEYSRPLSDRRGQSRADEIVVNSFMIVFTYLFGGYKDYLATMDHKTGEKQLQKSDFVHSFHSKSTRRFLDAFLMTQMFDKFIEEREDPVKAQAVNEGLFEMKLPELKERTQEIEIFSTKKRFPWQRKKTIQSKN